MHAELETKTKRSREKKKNKKDEVKELKIDRDPESTVRS